MKKTRIVLGLSLSLCAALATRAAADQRPLAERLRGLLVAAHRGGHPHPDSNTVERFEKARRAGADIIETDLQVSKDGVPFLFHDGRLDPTTICNGPVSERTASELERCTLRGLSHGPERFEAALQWSRGRVLLDVELKSAEVVRPAVELVRRYDAYEWVYFQGGNGWERYVEVRVLDPRVALELGPRGPHGQRQLARLLAMNDPHVPIIQLHPDMLSPETIDEIHASGRLASIDVWYVAGERKRWYWPFRPSACAQVFERGIDIAVTNTPLECARERVALQRGGNAN